MVLMFLLGQSLFSWAGDGNPANRNPSKLWFSPESRCFTVFLVTTSWELPLIGVAPQTSEVTIAELCRVLCSSCKGSIFSIWVAWDWVRSKRLYRMMCRQGRNSHQDQDTQVETAAHLNSRMIPFRVKLSPLDPFKWAVVLKNPEFHWIPVSFLYQHGLAHFGTDTSPYPCKQPTHHWIRYAHYSPTSGCILHHTCVLFDIFCTCRLFMQHYYFASPFLYVIPRK